MMSKKSANPINPKKNINSITISFCRKDPTDTNICKCVNYLTPYYFLLPTTILLRTLQPKVDPCPPLRLAGPPEAGKRVPLAENGAATITTYYYQLLTNYTNLGLINQTATEKYAKMKYPSFDKFLHIPFNFLELLSFFVLTTHQFFLHMFQ
jgi:hypothetical protein